MRLLLIEDDTDIAGNICDFLAARGHVVDWAYDGRSGRDQALAGGHDQLLVNVNLPGCDGFSLCRDLRATGDSRPVLFITARGEIEDKLSGFEAGAWDYLVKPFSLAELEARIRAAGLRSLPPSPIRFGPISWQPGRRLFVVEDKPLVLPNIAQTILASLIAAAPGIVPRDQLVSAIWGEEEPDSSPLRSHISDLRSRLSAFGMTIKTLRGAGYRLALKDNE